LSAEAKAAISGITAVFAKSTLPDRAKRLHELAHGEKEPSIDEVAAEVDGMRGEFDRLAKDLPAKVAALEKAEDGFANAVATLQGHLAKRGAAGGTGKNAPALAGYRDHLRGLYDRAQRAQTPAEKDNLARLLASSLQLWQAMQRAHGQLSDSERGALVRVIELLVERQTDLAVASTRTKAFLVSLEHGRQVMEHVGGVFGVLAESEKVLRDLQGLEGLGDMLTQSFDLPVFDTLGPVLERLLARGVVRVYEASGQPGGSAVVGAPAPSLAELEAQMRAVGVLEAGKDKLAQAPAKPPLAGADPQGGK
jgi:hypothetical protein